MERPSFEDADYEPIEEQPTQVHQPPPQPTVVQSAPQTPPPTSMPPRQDAPPLQPSYEEDEEETADNPGRFAAIIALILATLALAGAALGFFPLGGVKTQQLDDGAVTGEKLAPGAVSVEDLDLESQAELKGPPGEAGARGPRGPQGPRGPAGEGVTGLTVSEISIDPGVSGRADAQVECESGKAISGGARISTSDDSDPNAALTSNAPLEGRAGWEASAVDLSTLAADSNTPDTSPSWSLDVYAVCAATN